MKVHNSSKINFLGNVHILIQPTIQSLIDCLCCYITSTSWDELFSQALISANYQNSRHEQQDIGLVLKFVTRINNE